jgi:K+-transporting ATPase A subunit
MVRLLARLREWFQMLGGCTPLPAIWLSSIRVQVAIGVWWIILFLILTAFIGRSTKFIYVDF